MEIATFLPSGWALAALWGVAFVAAIVQSGLGMGFGLTAAPLAALIDPHFVPAPMLTLGFLTSALGAWAERHQVIWREVGVALTGRIAGIIPAMLLLASLQDRTRFLLFFGGMIGFAVVLSLAGWRLGFGAKRLFAMAGLSGLMGTITSVGAPPLAMVYAERPAAEARPTLAAFFALGCVVSLAGLWYAGWFGMREMVLAGLLLPPMIAGTLVGRRLQGRFARRYRPALLGLAGVAAVILIVRGFS